MIQDGRRLYPFNYGMIKGKDYITESYLRRKIEEAIFERIQAVMIDLCFNADHVVEYIVDMDHWFDKGEVACTAQATDAKGKKSVFEFLKFTIENRFYQSGGTVKRSAPENEASDPVTAGEYSVERNHGDSPLKHEINKSVTLEESQTSELSMGIQLDLTTKASASYAGVSAELEAHLGVTVNKSESQTSSKTETQGFSDEEEVPAGKEYAFVYQKTRDMYQQAYQIDAIPDIAFKLEILGAASGSGPHADYLFNHENAALWDNIQGTTWHFTHFDSVHQFCGFIRGYDPRAPHMTGFANKMGWTGRHKFSELENGERLVLNGTDTIVHDNDASYSVQDVSGVSDEDVDKLFGGSNHRLQDQLDKLADLKAKGA